MSYLHKALWRLFIFLLSGPQEIFLLNFFCKKLQNLQKNMLRRPVKFMACVDGPYVE